MSTIDIEDIKEELQRRVQEKVKSSHKSLTRDEIETEINRRNNRRLSSPVSLVCPIADIERCGSETYSENRCHHCPTAKSFFENCPASSAVIEEGFEAWLESNDPGLREQINEEVQREFDEESFTSRVVELLGLLIASLRRDQSTNEQRGVADLSLDELLTLKTLQEVSDDIEAGREPYPYFIITWEWAARIKKGLQDVITQTPEITAVPTEPVSDQETSAVPTA